jgi:hypothetical protein
MPDPLVVYVDCDDTLIRTAGSKRIPVSGVADHVRKLFADGAELYCWSTAGAAYARAVAEELRLADCFAGFLPKPQVMIDDQPVSDWRRTIEIYAGQVSAMSVEAYRSRLDLPAI